MQQAGGQTVSEMGVVGVSAQRIVALDSDLRIAHEEILNFRQHVDSQVYMDMCMCVCVCVCIYTNCVCMYRCTCTNMHVYIHIYVYRYIFVYI